MEQPGGAPANVAFHVAQKGVSSALISRIGHDEQGGMLHRWLRDAGVRTVLQKDPCHPTGRVEVRRTQPEPRYDILAPAAWDFLADDRTASDLVRRERVLVFGTLAQRSPASRRSIRRLVDLARGSGAVRFADLNLRAPFFDSETVWWTLRHADVLKLNNGELGLVSGMLGARGSEGVLFAGLVREFGLARAVLTCGASGAWIWEEGEMSHVAACPGVVVDCVGAGDAFTAMLVCGLARGRSLREAAPPAAKLASWVVSCRGATPAWTPRLRRLLDA